MILFLEEYMSWQDAEAQGILVPCLVSAHPHQQMALETYLKDRPWRLSLGTGQHSTLEGLLPASWCCHLTPPVYYL